MSALSEKNLPQMLADGDIEPEHIGQSMVGAHVRAMRGLSAQYAADPTNVIPEQDEFEVVSDNPYQCLEPMFSEAWDNFWCRTITLRRKSDGMTGFGMGPRRKAFEGAVRMIEYGGWDAWCQRPRE